MKLTFINVGYGEAILACTDRTKLLIDGGSALDAEYAGGKARVRCLDYLKAAGIDRLDLMICTHPHEDHVCAMEEIARAIPVEHFYTGVTPAVTGADLDSSIADDKSSINFMNALNAHRHLIDTFRRAGTPVTRLRAGMRIAPEEGLTLDVLAPGEATSEWVEHEIEGIYTDPDPLPRLRALDPKLNNTSVILKLRCEGVTAMLPGDTNRDGWSGFPDSTDLSAQIYKIGHHGQIDGASRTLLEAIRPEYVVFCSSSDRRYNSAHPDIISLVRTCGAEPLFIDPPGGAEHQGVCFEIKDGKISQNYSYIKGDGFHERV